MKKLILISVLSFTLINVFAGEDKFKDMMQKNIASLYAAESIADLQNVINAFDRIATAEKTKWEPLYYKAYGYVLISLKENNTEKKDMWLDLARTAVGKADALKQNDTEIIALNGFVTLLKISVDPTERGPQYSGSAMQSFSKALSLDPQNPRAMALDAQMKFGMAKFFGKNSDGACLQAQTALDLLAKENTSDTLAPRWGKGVADDLLKQCH